MKKLLPIIVTSALIIVWLVSIIVRHDDAVVYEPEVRVYVTRGRKMEDARYLYAGDNVEYNFPGGYKVSIIIELTNLRTRWQDTTETEEE